MVGLNYKDAREDALPWLARNGNPYQLSVYDAAGRIAIDYGVYGVPETYVIDRKGVIRYKHIGPLTPEVAQKKLVPLVKELERWLGLFLLLILIPRRSAPRRIRRSTSASPRSRDELRCLVCQNQTLADSNAPLAVDLRNQIREQLAKGASEREVREFMVARYGDFVLYRPPFKASTAALWIGPFALLLRRPAWLLVRRLRSRRAPEPALSRGRARARGEAARMTAFWIFGAALAALALVLLLRPLLRSRKSARIGPGAKRTSPSTGTSCASSTPTSPQASWRRRPRTLARRARGAPAGRTSPRPRRRCRPRARAAAGWRSSLLAVVPLFAAALYLAVGNPAALGAGQRSACVRLAAARRPGRAARGAHAREPRRRRGLEAARPLLRRARPLSGVGSTPTPRRRCASRAMPSCSPTWPTCSP